MGIDFFDATRGLPAPQSHRHIVAYFPPPGNSSFTAARWRGIASSSGAYLRGSLLVYPSMTLSPTCLRSILTSFRQEFLFAAVSTFHSLSPSLNQCCLPQLHLCVRVFHRYTFALLTLSVMEIQLKGWTRGGRLVQKIR